MRKQRKLILILAVVMSIALAAGSTMAYLQDTDEDVNVMTLGTVYINQLEYERVPEDGHERTNDAWVSTGETDKYGYVPDEIRLFTQDKPLYPAVFADGVIKWDDRLANNRAADEHQQSWADVKGEKVTGAPGSFQLFDDSVKNVIDKFVFVEH
ncbi:MAG: SipW-dependent-type signal peptide-containing protein, partial [Clostridia bacterium]|nr:SipW-dependent-type signal peptide-containing protein [Clostridia bacterium]